MTTEYVLSTLRDDLIERWSDKPTGPLEQRLLNVWERHPQLVLDASEQITERYDRGIVRSPWAVLLKHVEQAAESAERADRPAKGEQGKAKARSQAEQWIRAAGIHFDIEREVEDALFGHFGPLRSYADDPELVESMLALWQHERPRGVEVERQVEERSIRDKKANAIKREALIRKARAQLPPEPEPEPLIGAGMANPFFDELKRVPHLPRLLALRSQYGYTARGSEALTLEPEAVSADEQQAITRAAHRSADERAQALLTGARERIGAELDYLTEQRLDGRTASTVRAMQRQLAQLGRRRSASP